jgi:mutual gliding-motility protein MglA
MVLVSYSGKEINAKLVYYGPGLSGKTTNLEYIYGSIPGTHRGKMVSMKTKTERTLFFDFLPVQLGELSGFKTRFLLYTVPGQVYYNATRKLVLKGVDAVVFVADSKRGKMDENVESLQNLRENLLEHGHKLEDIPFVLQYNKRDLPEVYSISELDQVLNPMHVPAFEAVATSGPGVVETFKAVSKLLLKKLADEIGVPIVGSGKSEGIELGTEAPAKATPIVTSTHTPPPGSATRPTPIPQNVPPSAKATPVHGTATPEEQTNRTSGGVWAQQQPTGARGAGSKPEETSPDPELRVERYSLSSDPPAAEMPPESRNQSGFTSSLGAPVHGLPGRSSSTPAETLRASATPADPVGVRPAPSDRLPEATHALPEASHTLQEAPPQLDSANRRSTETDDESRNSGVGARLRRWLKREDEPETDAEPSSGTGMWQTHAKGGEHPTSQDLAGRNVPSSSAPPSYASSSSVPPPSYTPPSYTPTSHTPPSHTPPSNAPSSNVLLSNALSSSAPSTRSASGNAPSGDEPPNHAIRSNVPSEVTHSSSVRSSAPEEPVLRSLENDPLARSGGRAHEDGPFSDRSSERMSDRRDERFVTNESRFRGQAREITVPLELTPQDLETGIVVRLAVRLRDSLEDEERRRRAA